MIDFYLFDVDFNIATSTDETIIFVAVVYDSDFADFLDEHSKTLEDLFSDVQSNPIDLHLRANSTYLSSNTNGMEDLFDLNLKFSAIEEEWWDDNGNSSAVPSVSDILSAGQTFLNSGNDWNYLGNHGTDDYNHGFDLLFALRTNFSGQTLGQNQQDRSCDQKRFHTHVE